MEVAHSMAMTFCTFNIRLNDNRRSVTIRSSLSDAEEDKKTFIKSGFTSYIAQINVIDVPTPVTCEVYDNRQNCAALIESIGSNEVILWVAKAFNATPEKILFIEG